MSMWLFFLGLSKESVLGRTVFSLTAAPSDETRVSYLLQGVESAWDSIGRRNPHTRSKNPPVSAHRHEPDGAAASSSASRSAEVGGQKGGGLDGGDELRGAEAMVDVPQAGDNVSSATLS